MYRIIIKKWGFLKCIYRFFFFLFFFFHWHYSPLWALACRTMSFHFFQSATNSLHLLTPSTWRSLSTSSFHPFLGLPLLLVPSSSWVKTFLGILSSSILSRWPNQLILCPFIHFTIFSPLSIRVTNKALYLAVGDRNVSNIVCFLLGNSPASQFYMPTFRNTLSVPSS